MQDATPPPIKMSQIHPLTVLFLIIDVVLYSSSAKKGEEPEYEASDVHTCEAFHM